MELEVRVSDCRAHLSLVSPVLVYAIPALASVLIAWAIIAWYLRNWSKR